MALEKKDNISGKLPQQAEVSATTSSIGPTYPPQEASFGRIKGFDTRGVALGRAGFLKSTVEIIEQYIPQLDASRSRVSLRLLATNNALNESLDILESFGEAVIPLRGAGDGFDDLNMVYVGHNLPDDRAGAPEDLSTIQQNIATACCAETYPYQKIIHRLEGQGYELQTPDIEQRTMDNNLRNQMAVLYERFGWDYDEVMEILENPDSIIAVVTKDGVVVGAGLAESATVSIPSANGVLEFRMAELTEAATFSEHQGKGLYTGVAAQLLRAIALLPSEKRLHLVFGECNGLSLGVLKATKRLGRTFASEVSAQLGLPVKGYLPQHVPIAGVDRRTEFNDLVPSYILADTIQDLYGSGIE